MRHFFPAILFFLQAISLGMPHACGQTSPFLFHHLGNLNENGINFVNDILFDSKNRVWLAGQTGFYQYDGHHYKSYRKTKDTKSIPDNFVHALCEDKQGNIWGGTQAGIFRFNPATQRFKQYPIPDASADQGVFNICCDTNGGLWAATTLQLLYYSPTTDSFEVRLDVRNEATVHGGNSIRKRGMLPSQDGKYLWLTTRKGLWAYDIAGNTFLNNLTQPQNPLFTNMNTSALAKGTSGLFLFFDNTNKDIVHFDPKSLTIVKRISIGRAMPEAAGATLFEAKDGGIWFCSWGNQIVMVNPHENNKLYDLNGKVNESLGVLSNFFWQARQDEDGSIWLATPEGVFICNEPKNLFKIHRLNKVIPALNPQVFIDVFAENPVDQTWWLTTSGNKGIHFITPNPKNNPFKTTSSSTSIIHYDPRLGSYETIDYSKAPPNRWGLKPLGINGIRFFNNSPVIITNNGVWLWQATSKKWQTFETATGINFPFNISDIVGDDKQGYYITDYQALAYFDFTKKSVHKIAISGAKPSATNDIKLFSRQQFKPNIYGSIGVTGLIKLHTDSARFIPLVQDIRTDNIGYIDDIDVDSKGQVWVSLKNVGLFMYNAANGKIHRWDESDGLAINGIHNLTIDRRDNIWTIHRRQFSVLLAGTDRFFNIAMPIANPILNWPNNLVTLKNGHVVANNFNEMVEFFPDRLLQKPVPRLPEISSLFVNEAPRIFSPGKTLTLSPTENSLHFKFGMLTNKVFFPHEIQYKLDGAEANWQAAGEGHEAFYNKLPPGNYSFKVRAVATNGSWASGEQVIKLVIEKPVYQQIWFIVLISLFILGLLVAISRYRLIKQRQVFQLETKSAILEREKATIQYDSLKQQLNPHFLFNSLTSLRSLIKTDSKTAAWFLDSLSKVYRYVLKSSTSELVMLKNEVDFVTTFSELQRVRFGEGLQVHITISDDAGQRHTVPVVLQILVENAIKHNTTSIDSPLIIEIFTDGSRLIVRNKLQRYRIVETSNQQGLESLKKLYSFYTDEPVKIDDTDGYFTVSIPLL